MNNVTVSADRKVASVGGGARWQDVSLPLDRLGLGVAGGREAPVGVGGLTTGGGKSFFSSKVGFVCDGLHSVEIVTGGGEILLASATSHADLFRAVKGGSNNFGIITTFHFTTFPLGSLWGGFSIHPVSVGPQLFTALSAFIDASGETYDPPGDAEAIIAYVKTPTSESFANFYSNTLPVAYPPVLSNMTGIRPRTTETFAVTNLTTLTVELNTGQANGARANWFVFTVANDADYFLQAQQAFSDMLSPLLSNPSVTQANLAFQPLTKSMLAPGCGKNSLGLCPSDGNLVIINLSVFWTDASADAAVNAVCVKYLDAMRELAKRKGILHRYVYLNYAGEEQDPIGSYGGKSVERMRAVSKKYDPEGVFQKLVPGGFKLWH